MRSIAHDATCLAFGLGVRHRVRVVVATAGAAVLLGQGAYIRAMPYFSAVITCLHPTVERVKANVHSVVENPAGQEVSGERDENVSRLAHSSSPDDGQVGIACLKVLQDLFIGEVIECVEHNAP